jgi:hypothetical protein
MTTPLFHDMDLICPNEFHMIGITSNPAVMALLRSMSLPSSVYPGHPTALVDGIAYRLTGGTATIVGFLGEAFDIPDAIVFEGRLRDVTSIDLFFCRHVPEAVTIPSHVLVIEGPSFMGMKVRSLLFRAESRLRPLAGFQCSSIIRLTVPESVEIIKPDAFSQCYHLTVVEFRDGSHIRHVSGFAATAVRTIAFPGTLEELAPEAFYAATDLSVMTFCTGSVVRRICVTSGLRRLILPPSCERPTLLMPESRAWLRVFIDYPTETLSSARRRCAATFAHAIPAVIRESVAVPSSWTVASSWANVPVIDSLPLDEPECLSFNLRYADRELPLPAGPHTRHFETLSATPSRSLSLGSIVAMLSSSPHFACGPGRHARGPHFTFHIGCLRCGEDYAVVLDCPFSGRDLKLSTRRCCGHFFDGRLLGGDRRTVTRFITRGRVTTDPQYGFYHPLRVIARTLLRHDGELGLAERSLLQQWIDRGPTLQHGLLVSHHDSLNDLLGALPGRFFLLPPSLCRSHPFKVRRSTGRHPCVGGAMGISRPYPSGLL